MGGELVVAEQRPGSELFGRHDQSDNNWLVLDGIAPIYTNKCNTLYNYGCEIVALAIVAIYKPLNHKSTLSVLLCHIFKGQAQITTWL